MADQFRTQDGPLLGVVSYTLQIPGNLWFIAEVSDLLHDMTDPANWVQDGTVTIDEAAEAATDMYLGFGPMIGQVFPMVAAAPPPNCLLCDGTTYLRVDYPLLYAALDSAFVIDADHFLVPDLRGSFVLGASVTYPPGAAGGEVDHTLTVAEIPAHGHAYGGTLLTSTVTPPPLDGASPNPIPAVTGSTGGGAAHNNMPPYVALTWAVVAS